MKGSATLHSSHRYAHTLPPTLLCAPSTTCVFGPNGGTVTSSAYPSACNAIWVSIAVRMVIRACHIQVQYNNFENAGGGLSSAPLQAASILRAQEKRMGTARLGTSARMGTSRLGTAQRGRCLFWHSVR